MSDLLGDQIVGQRYQLIERLGEGGMGEVWSALHLVTRKAVAIKFLKKHEKATVNEQLTQRFLREARAASAIHHPNVVEVHDVLTHDDGMPMMVMDLLRGRTLSSLLELKPLDAKDMATILLPIVSAVGTAHALGIVHRDLKPDNLFLAQLGDGRVEPKVLDFGIAKLALDDNSAAGLTATGSMLGTPYYMSPEQMFGEKNIDGKSDVWSLGVIMYECLSGTRPFDGENFGQLMKAISTAAMLPVVRVAPQTPPEMVTMLESMLKVDRKQRPTIEEVHAFLTNYSQSANSSRISVRNLPSQFVAERTSFLAPQSSPRTGPGASPNPSQRAVTGPQMTAVAALPPMQAPPPHMMNPHTGPHPQYGAMHQTGPRTPTPVPNAMSNSQFGAQSQAHSHPHPSTLSGAATSQTGGAIPRPPTGMPLAAVLGIIGGLVLIAGVGILLVMKATTHGPHTAAADAQTSASVRVAETPTASVPAVMSAPAPVPTIGALAPPTKQDAGGKLATTPTLPDPAPGTHTGAGPAPGPAPAPAPGGKPPGKNPSGTATTVPGGVATTVPF